MIARLKIWLSRPRWAVVACHNGERLCVRDVYVFRADAEAAARRLDKYSRLAPHSHHRVERIRGPVDPGERCVV